MDGNEKYRGLTEAEVEKSRLKYGVNELEAKTKPNLLQRIVHVFKEPMFLLLLVTASIYFFLGEVTDGLIMLGFILFISGIEFVQEQKTDRAIEELNTLSAINIKVIRDGRREVIDSRDLVVGDIVLLEEGDKVPADGVILEAQGLGVNESALTGESEVVYKKAIKTGEAREVVEAEAREVVDTGAEGGKTEGGKTEAAEERFRRDMCFAGTDVTNGSAVIRVTAVGTATEYGKIGSALKSIKKVSTPLEKQVRKLIVICTVVSLSFCLVVTLVNFFYNAELGLKERLTQSILSGITMAMATIPEEIPVVLTVFLAMGAWKLAKQKALTRNMKAVETLGAVTVLCTDKTGTLTQNKMTVQEVATEAADFAEVAALACAKTPYDPMEIAIQDYALAQGVERGIYDHELVHEYIFNNEDKMMGQVWALGDSRLLCVKGASESVLPLCELSRERKEKIEQQMKKFAEAGYRVLAVAKRKWAEKDAKMPEELEENRLEFVGLVALMDPPREGVKAAVESCHHAGVRIIMITGDNGETAEGIARQIGLRNSSEIITGPELEKMSDEELAERVKTTNIFARVYPTHKMRIVQALQKNREVVAMTGDGVNDAPALKKAEIGIAMGQRGTNVAKEAADLILMDDNFSTIVAAIENGRVIYSNIKKAIAYILVIHIPIILVSLFVPLVGLPLLLLPVHIVLLELIIDPTSSIIFQRLKADKDVMSEPPRRLNEALLSKAVVVRSVLQGVAIFAVVFAGYWYMLDTGRSQALAATFAFTTLVFANVMVVYVLQSSDLAVKNFILDLKDKVIVLINTVIVAVLLLLIYVPFLSQLVGMQALSFWQLLAAIGLAMVGTLVFEVSKGRR